MEEDGVMSSAAAAVEVVGGDVSLVQELEEVPSEIKMDNDEAANDGIESRVRSRKGKASHSIINDKTSEREEGLKPSILDYHVSDFGMFKLPPKKRKSDAWISRMQEDLRDGTIAPRNKPEESEESTIGSPKTTEDVGTILQQDMPK